MNLKMSFILTAQTNWHHSLSYDYFVFVLYYLVCAAVHIIVCEKNLLPLMYSSSLFIVSQFLFCLYYYSILLILALFYRFLLDVMDRSKYCIFISNIVASIITKHLNSLSINNIVILLVRIDHNISILLYFTFLIQRFSPLMRMVTLTLLWYSSFTLMLIII